jgi:hypothetical protein
VSKGSDGAEHGLKQLLLTFAFAVFVAVLAALGTGVTLGALSGASPDQVTSLAAGTVTLDSDTSGTCTVASMMPGSMPSPCSLTGTYSGSTPAYLAVDVTIETQSGNGGTTLYNPSDSGHDLQVAISSTSPSVSYTVPVTATTCPGSAPSGSTCYGLDNEIASLTPFTSASGPVTIHTTVSLPANSTPRYRGGAAQVILSVHAAQSGNNSATGCTAGETCDAVRWS